MEHPNPLIIAIPTADMRAVVPSILELHHVSQLLARPIRFAVAEASSIPRSRNAVLEQLRTAHSDRSSVWVLWMDSDIVIAPDSARSIAVAIRWADENQAGIVANYRMTDGRSVLMTTRDPETTKHYTDIELSQIEDFSPIGMAGFGFLYLPPPLNYVFRSDLLGEDIHFWLDHPSLPLHWAKHIQLGHKKSVLIT